MEKKYNLRVDPRILKILSETLYTNVYYVLSELVANAYDADAKNVYITISEESLSIEDDGNGMNLEQVENYLNVGNESRKDEVGTFTKNGRRKMGRKGIGKLAALSLAESYILFTKQNGNKNGFIVQKEIDSLGELTGLSDDFDGFKYNTSNNGTIVIVENMNLVLHKRISTIAKNILKIFPNVSNDFRIHIYYNGKSQVLNNYDEEILSQLASIITIGEEYKKLKEIFDLKNINSDLSISLHKSSCTSEKINILNSLGELECVEVDIKGWIGTYKSTKGNNRDISDFPDNHISIFANGKLGEFNILPSISKNRMPESYVVGHLHVDILEKSTLKDISLSNRQGYNTNDIRYQKAMELSKSLLVDALSNFDAMADRKKESKDVTEIQEKKRKEGALIEETEQFSHNLFLKLNKHLEGQQLTENSVKEIFDTAKVLISLKDEVKENKRKILLSHTKKDKVVADIVYEMLLNNGFSPEEIIYTNSSNQESRMKAGPYGNRIWDYLKDFFVDSVVKQGIYVIYITSENMSKSWGALVEVGAGWITRASEKQHMLININNYNPRSPLDVDSLRVDFDVDLVNNVLIDEISCDTLCQAIEDISIYFNKNPQSRAENTIFVKKTTN